MSAKAENNILTQLESLKKEEKFLPENNQGYMGILDESVRVLAEVRMNAAIDNFIETAKKNSSTTEDYLNDIDKGLLCFQDIYIDLDTEDLERVASYFEEIMDIVGLESSNGRLNKFLYGFDPAAE